MLLLLAALSAFPWIYSHIEAHQHLKRFIANGSNQNGQHKFHRQALVWRGVWIQGFGLIACGLHVFLTGEFPLALYAAWSVYAWVVFGYNFTRVLNRIRHERFPDYNISPWYQSRQVNAAWTDRTIVAYAAKWGLTPEKLAERIYTVSLALAFLLLAFVIVDK